VVQPFEYLDHPATSFPRAPGVVEAMAAALSSGNPGRSSHRHSEQAEALVRRVREQTAAHFEIQDSGRVIFTSGATMSLNVALQGTLRPGDHVVTTCLEHTSVLRPLRALEQRGCRVSIVRRLRPDGEFIELLEREIRPETRLIAVTHASNVLGTVLPIEEITAVAHQHGVFVLLDAAQSVGHIPLSLSRVKVDLVAFGAHKGLMGPPGVGLLLVNNTDVGLVPLTMGGTGFYSDQLAPPLLFPLSFEVGTPNLPAIAGLGAALSYSASPQCVEMHRGIEALHRMCVSELTAIEGVHVHSEKDLKSVPIISFMLRGLPPAQTAEILDREFGIQVRQGLHCAPLLHEALGTLPHGTLRVGFGPGNTLETAKRLCAAVRILAGGAEQET
jgi:cysteine desulfurase / selenocysteine lyase